MISKTGRFSAEQPVTRIPADPAPGIAEPSTCRPDHRPAEQGEDADQGHVAAQGRPLRPRRPDGAADPRHLRHGRREYTRQELDAAARSLSPPGRPRVSRAGPRAAPGSERAARSSYSRRAASSRVMKTWSAFSARARPSRAARGSIAGERHHRAHVARDEDLEAREAQRLDDRVGDVLGLELGDEARVRRARRELGVHDHRQDAGDLDGAAAQLEAHGLARADDEVLGAGVRRGAGEAAAARPSRPCSRCGRCRARSSAAAPPSCRAGRRGR